jgi:hypothetical protein
VARLRFACLIDRGDSVRSFLRSSLCPERDCQLICSHFKTDDIAGNKVSVFRGCLILKALAQSSRD